MGRPYRGTGRGFRGRVVPLERVKPPPALRAGKNPRITGASPVPHIVWTAQGVRTAQQVLRQWPQRMVRGRTLVLIALADILREEVQARAPALSGVPYAADLQVALLDGVDVGEGVAVYFEGQATALSPERRAEMLLFVVPRRGARRGVTVLADLGPWPADLLPWHPPAAEADVVARASRPDEVDYYRTELERNWSRVVATLRNAGVAVPAHPPTTGDATGTVYEDVAWAVLRAEFGFGGGGAQPHWRPALAALWQRIPRVMRAYVTYVQTGRWPLGSLPTTEGPDITEMSDAEFTRRIAPFAPRQMLG